MIRKLVVTTFIFAIYVSTQNFLAAQTGQSGNAGQASSPSANKKMAGGHKSVVGCVVQQDGEFYLKTDEGTYQFNTDRDLTPYVGKKVRIAGTWQATGVTTTAPVKNTAATDSDTAESTSNAPTSFAGDLRLHITGDVLGDCATPK
jgi:hypothetical protein